jgi:hypothetical protein
MHKLELDYEFDHVRFKTAFVINNEKNSIEVLTSRVLPKGAGSNITYRAIRSLDLRYEEGLMTFVHPYSKDVSCTRKETKEFVSSFLEPSGFFGQVYLAAIVECFLWVAI